MTSDFMQGGVAACFILGGLFFFRFWRETRDQLFILFASSFWIQAGVRITLSFTDEPEEHAYLYMLRLLAFLMIVAAILLKNIKRDPLE